MPTTSTSMSMPSLFLYGSAVGALVADGRTLVGFVVVAVMVAHASVNSWLASRRGG